MWHYKLPVCCDGQRRGTGQLSSLPCSRMQTGRDKIKIYGYSGTAAGAGAFIMMDFSSSLPYR